MFHRTFVVWDYLVFISMMVASIGIGIFYAIKNRQQQNTEEYLFAARSMKFLPVAISMLASFESSIMMLGIPAEGYAYGIQWILGKLSSTCPILLEIVLLVPFFKKLNLLSPFQYLEGRFKSRALRLVATTVKCIDTLMYMSTVLYGQGIALQTVTGISMSWSILLTASAAVIYTTIGGLRAVIWTDVLQLTFMFSGILALLIKGTIDAGGVDEVWTRAQAGGRLAFDLDPDPTRRQTVWTLLFGMAFTGFGLLFNPIALQRISSTRSVSQAQRALLTTALGFPLTIGTAFLLGIVAYGYYDYKGCDPIKSLQVDSVNQIVPYMLLDVFRYQPGLPGLFLAAVFSASLSTLSSGLSGLACVTVEDFARSFSPGLTEFKAMVIARGSVVAYGVFSCCLAFVISMLGAESLVKISYSLFSVTMGPISGLFYLGLLFPFVNTKSAIAALVAGVSFLVWLLIGATVSRGVRRSTYLPPASIDRCPVINSTLTDGANVTTTLLHDSAWEYTGSGLDAFYSLSYTLYSCFGFLLVLLLGVILSLLTGDNKGNVDLEYVLPLNEKLASCFPRSVREYLLVDGTKEQSEVEKRIQLRTDAASDQVHHLSISRTSV